MGGDEKSKISTEQVLFGTAPDTCVYNCDTHAHLLPVPRDLPTLFKLIFLQVQMLLVNQESLSIGLKIDTEQSPSVISENS